MNKLDRLKPYPLNGHYRWLESLKILANYGEQRYYREGIRWSYFRIEGFAYHFVYLAGDDKFKPIREKCWPLIKGDTVSFNKLDRLPLFHFRSKVNDNALEGYYSRLHYTKFNRARYFWVNIWWIGLNISGKLLSFTKLRYMWKCRLLNVDAVNNGRCTGYFQWRLEVAKVKLPPIQSHVTASKVPDDLAKESGVSLMPSKSEAATEVDRLKPSVDRQQTETSTPMDRPKVDTLEDWIDYWGGRVAEAEKAGYFDTGNVKAGPVEFMQQDPIGVDRSPVTDYLSQSEQAHRGIFRKWWSANGAEADPRELKPDVEADPNISMDRPFTQEYPMDRPETTPMDRPSLTTDKEHAPLSIDADSFKVDPASKLKPIQWRDNFTGVEDGPLNLKADPSEVATLKPIQPNLVRRSFIRSSIDKNAMEGYNVKADPTLDAEDISRLERDIANSKPGEIIWISSAEMEAIRAGSVNVQASNREVYADPYEAQEKAG